MSKSVDEFFEPFVSRFDGTLHELLGVFLGLLVPVHAQGLLGLQHFHHLALLQVSVIVCVKQNKERLNLNRADLELKRGFLSGLWMRFVLVLHVIEEDFLKNVEVEGFQLRNSAFNLFDVIKEKYERQIFLVLHSRVYAFLLEHSVHFMNPF